MCRPPLLLCFTLYQQTMLQFFCYFIYQQPPPRLKFISKSELITQIVVLAKPFPLLESFLLFCLGIFVQYMFFFYLLLFFIIFLDKQKSYITVDLDQTFAHLAKALNMLCRLQAAGLVATNNFELTMVKNSRCSNLSSFFMALLPSRSQC